MHTTANAQQPANTNRNTTPKPPNKENDTTTYRHPTINSVTFNTRGMHTTILDLHYILNSKHKPTIIHLTEIKHINIKSIWRDSLKDYKLTHTHPKLDPNTLRRSTCTILATRRDIYKEVTPIQMPTNLMDYIKAAKITPHDGTPIIAISAYMPQLHTTEQELIYLDIL
jgi:hypothetical protein